MTDPFSAAGRFEERRRAADQQRALERIRVIETHHVIKEEWYRHKAGWQLPCGCIGPDIWINDQKGQSECTDCGRGWKWMTTMCEMLDGLPQGEPVLVLLDEAE